MTAPMTQAMQADLTPLPFAEALERAGRMAQAQIASALAGDASQIGAAMAHAVDGGKGLRAFLVMESARLHGIARAVSQTPAAGIEALHAYSLIHDDLPCMDDDDMRRGKPTVHRQWDEATAVLAGDALQSLAFQLVAETDCGAQERLALLHGLSTAAGLRGMVGGQAMDIAAETAETPLNLDQITRLQAGKTGALITWSATAGAVMAGESPNALRIYGDALGLAFQIWDDVLDVEGDAAMLGKAVGKDADRGKATFVSILGLDGAKRRAEALVTEAQDALSQYQGEAECLQQAARFVIARRS